MDRIAIAAAVWLLPVSLCAQWLDLRTPGIPRTDDGKPNLTAPAPRTPDGKPDLSGIWRPEVNPYRFTLIQDLKDEGVFRPPAEAIGQHPLGVGQIVQPRHQPETGIDLLHPAVEFIPHRARQPGYFSVTTHWVFNFLE